jgi:hypothetical protein
MGIRFTTPANAKMIVAGICGFLPTATGTPTVGIFWNLLDASHSLIASTDTIPAGVIKNQANGWYSGNFSSGYGNQTLQPSTTYSITLTSPVSADTSSNAYPQRQYQWDSDLNSTPLIPYGIQQDFFDGTSWTQTANIILPIGLLLVTGGEFAATGGGIVVVQRKTFSFPSRPNIARRAVIVSGGAGATVFVPMPASAKRIVYPPRQYPGRRIVAALLPGPTISTITPIRTPPRQNTKQIIVYRNRAAALLPGKQVNNVIRTPPKFFPRPLQVTRNRAAALLPSGVLTVTNFLPIRIPGKQNTTTRVVRRNTIAAIVPAPAVHNVIRIPPRIVTRQTTTVRNRAVLIPGLTITNFLPVAKPARVISRVQVVRRNIAAAILPGANVLTMVRMPPKQITKTQFIRRNAGSALFNQVQTTTVLVKSNRVVR